MANVLMNNDICRRCLLNLDGTFGLVLIIWTLAYVNYCKNYKMISQFYYNFQKLIIVKVKQQPVLNNVHSWVFILL